MAFRHRKLRSKMLLYFLGFNFLVSLAFLLVNMTFSRQTLVFETQHRALEKVKGSAIAIEGFLKEKSKVGTTMSQDPILIHWLEANTQRGADHSQDRPYQTMVEFFKSSPRQSTKSKPLPTKQQRSSRRSTRSRFRPTCWR